LIKTRGDLEIRSIILEREFKFLFEFLELSIKFMTEQVASADTSLNKVSYF
jgi:hypothetical protein